MELIEFGGPRYKTIRSNLKKTVLPNESEIKESPDMADLMKPIVVSPEDIYRILSHAGAALHYYDSRRIETEDLRRAVERELDEARIAARARLLDEFEKRNKEREENLRALVDNGASSRRTLEGAMKPITPSESFLHSQVDMDEHVRRLKAEMAELDALRARFVSYVEVIRMNWESARSLKSAVSRYPDAP